MNYDDLNELQKLAFDYGYQSEMEKLAKKDDRPESGWLNREMASYRARRWGDKGEKVLLNSPEYMKEQLKAQAKDGAAGGAAGAAAGAAIAAATKGRKGLGAALGGLLGGAAGQYAGSYKADTKYLDKRGIKKKWGGLDYELSDKAKKKYLHKDYKGGGYGKN